MNTTIDPSTLNTTTTTSTGVTTGQFILLGGLCGTTIATNIIGLVGTFLSFLSSKSKQFWKVAAIMSLFNIVSIIYSFLFSTVMVAEADSCAAQDRWTNISSQMFFFLFDSFMLYKTYATTSCNKLLADAFATITCLSFNYKAFSQKWATVIRTLIQENILRSIVIVATNSLILFVAANVTDQFSAAVSFVIQNNVYAIALNSELYWMEARKSSAASKKGTTTKSGVSAGQQKTSSAGGGARQKSLAANEH
ncbi:hypothetical protein HDU98_002233 [Podochytrium sp. JEL0797]|nr:hypothetical protein HDU98_002233 [Podochytrium sp. JEL0797]